MKLRLYVLAMTVLAVMSVVVEDASARFVDYSAPSKFIEVDVHALGGGSSVTQNYRGCFPQIQNLNVNMGYSLARGLCSASAIISVSVQSWICCSIIII